MKRLLIFSLFILSFSVKAQNILISDSLIHKIIFSKMENYNENYQIMLQLSKEVIAHTKNQKDSIFGDISVFYANLDIDEDIELIGFFGRVSNSNFLAFDKIDNQWYLIYRERIDLDSNRELFYGISPTEKNPLIWIKYHNGHGSGEYSDKYLFYRFTKEGLKKVLVLAGKKWKFAPIKATYLNLDMQNFFEPYPDGNFRNTCKSKILPSL